jgi:hypothetical protein
LAQGPGGLVNIFSTNQDIDILRVTNGGFIDSSHPSRHRIPSHHGVGDAGFFQGRGRPHESFSDFFHGSNHPFQYHFAGVAFSHGLIVPDRSFCRYDFLPENRMTLSFFNYRTSSSDQR